MGEKPSQTNPMEQYILLAKQAKGAAAVQLVKQVLEAPELYVFGELLDMPNITNVSVPLQSFWCFIAFLFHECRWMSK